MEPSSNNTTPHPSWMDDPLVQNIPPKKLEFLGKLFTEGHGKNQKQLMSMIMPMMNKAKAEKLTFTQTEINACIQAIKNGTVDAISTDHAPHTADEKSDFEKAPNGSIGMETSLSVSYTALCKSDEIDFMHLLKLMSTNPAKIANLNAGRLEVGAPADIVLFDQDAEYVIDKNKLHGKSTNCPFDKMKVNGRVLQTVVGGEIVYNFEEE